MPVWRRCVVPVLCSMTSHLAEGTQHACGTNALLLMLLLLQCSCWSGGRRKRWETRTTRSKPGCGTAHGCTACLPQSCWQPPPWRSLQPGLLRGSSAQACLLLRLAAAGPAAQWRPSACGAWLSAWRCWQLAAALRYTGSSGPGEIWRLQLPQLSGAGFRPHLLRMMAARRC